MIVSILLNILFILLLLMLLLIFWPISYKGRFSYEENFACELTLKTLLIRFCYRRDKRGGEGRIKIMGFTFFRQKKEEEKSRPEAEKKTPAEDAGGDISKKIKSLPEAFRGEIICRANLVHLKKHLVRLLSRLIPHSYRISLSVGCPEPHWNGLILSFYYALIYPRTGDRITCQIDWERELFAGRGEFEGRFSPVEIIFILLLFLFSRRTMKMIYHIIKRRRSR